MKKAEGGVKQTSPEKKIPVLPVVVPVVLVVVNYLFFLANYSHYPAVLINPAVPAVRRRQA